MQGEIWKSLNGYERRSVVRLTNKPTRMCGNKMNAAVVTMPQITEVNNAIRFVSATRFFSPSPKL